MNIKNHTDYAANFSPGMLPDGRTCLVVVVKATYDFPAEDGGKMTVAEKQVEIYDSDEFTGEPGESSPLYENDYATYKPKCDVIIQNSVAYTPNGEPAQRVEVGLQMEGIDKRFIVTGRRYWEKKNLGFVARPSEAQAFLEQPLSWEIAYGGIDKNVHEDKEQEDERSESYPINPIGAGYWYQPEVEQVELTTIAQTESIDQPINKPQERYKPQGFGPIARSWMPRSQYGGTYDDKWEQHVKPFLPDDFDSLYYQCAPADQQIDYPQGGEIITLKNLTPEGLLQLPLPTLDIPIEVQLSNGGSDTLDYAIDTLTLDMEKKQLSLVARAVKPLKNSMHEVGAFIIGHQPEEDEEEEMDDFERFMQEALAAADSNATDAKPTGSIPANNDNVVQLYKPSHHKPTNPGGETL